MRLAHRYIPDRQLPDKAGELARHRVRARGGGPACDACRSRGLPASHRGAAERAGNPGARGGHRRGEQQAIRARRARAVCSGDSRRGSKALRGALGTARRRWSRRFSRCAATAASTATTHSSATRTTASVERLAGSCRQTLAQLQGDAAAGATSVDEPAVASVVADWTGIPVGRMVKNEISSVLALAETLAQRVIGQDAALDTIARRVQTARAESRRSAASRSACSCSPGPPASARRKRRWRWPKRSTAASRIWSRST